MAKQAFFILDMKRQRGIAIWTFQNMPAIAAEDVGGCPASVEEEDGLLAPSQCGLKFLEQKPAKGPAMTGL